MKLYDLFRFASFSFARLLNYDMVTILKAEASWEKYDIEKNSF